MNRLNVAQNLDTANTDSAQKVDSLFHRPNLKRDARRFMCASPLQLQKTDTQVLFSEFSRLERKPTNLLRDLEKFQSLGVYAWFSKQNLWVRDDKERRLFSELKYGKAIGEYSFAAFDEFVKDKGMFGEFAPYDFK